MRFIQFYRGEIATDDGDYLNDIIHNWSYERMEGCHSYVQWVFPLMEGSMFHPEVPCLTLDEIKLFRSELELRYKVMDAYVKMLDFYGIEMRSGFTVQFQEPGKHKNPIWWLKQFNHNFLRITRILKSMRLLGFEYESLSLFKLLTDIRPDWPVISDNSYSYWKDAATGPLGCEP